MKLINISKSEDSYTVKALHPLKVLGLQLFSSIRMYRYSEDKDSWYDEKSKRKVSPSKNIKLNKWLKDHQKFIEKTEV